MNRTRVHRRAQPAPDALRGNPEAIHHRSAPRLLRVTALLLAFGLTVPAQAQAVNGQHALIQLSDSDVQQTTPTLYITDTHQSVFHLDSEVLKISSANPKMFELEVDGNTITIKSVVKVGITDLIITTTDGKQGIFDLRAVSDTTPNLPRTVTINFNKPVVVRTTPAANTSGTVSTTLQALIDARAARRTLQTGTTLIRPTYQAPPAAPASTAAPVAQLRPAAPNFTGQVTGAAAGVPTVAAPAPVPTPPVMAPVMAAPAPVVSAPALAPAPAFVAPPSSTPSTTQAPGLAWTTQTMMTTASTTIYYTLNNSGSKAVFLDSARLRADIDGKPVTLSVNRINTAPVLSPGQSDYGSISLPAFKGGVLTVNWDMTDQTGTAFTYTRSINAQQSNAGR